jgi:DNA-binding HxlR family transcriptional regulator
MDQDGGVTISGDRFVLTTVGSEPGQLDTVISQLQSVTRTSYGQYCGLSRAVEMVGERWGMLIIRDLLVGPRSEAELRMGLPLIAAGPLTMRLRELSHSGVIRRTTEPDGETRFELTEYGRVLEDVVLALGRWGAAALGAPRPEEIVTEDSVMTMLWSTFQADAALDVEMCFELHVGEVVVHAAVDHGRLGLYRGPTSDADTVIEPGPLLKSLLTGEVEAADALDGGQVVMSGAPELLDWFVSIFHLPTLPSPLPA